MEDAEPEGLQGVLSVADPPAECEDDRDDGFDGHGDERDAREDASHVAHGHGVGLAHGREPCPQAESSGHEEAEQGRERHHPEAADLDEGQDHDVSERRPEDGCVDDDVPRDAQGARRREEGLDEGGRSPLDGERE